MIRSLRARDLESYRTIRGEALRTDRDAFGETSEFFGGRASADFQRWFKRHVDSSRSGILVYEIDGVPRAMCGFGISDGDSTEGFLWGLFVSPSVRGRGIGAALLKEVEAWLTCQAVQWIKAKVAAPNVDAIRFYELAGYSVGPSIGYLRDGSSVPVHEIRLDLRT